MHNKSETTKTEETKMATIICASAAAAAIIISGIMAHTSESDEAAQALAYFGKPANRKAA